MGSQSDWDTMQHAAAQLDELKDPYEVEMMIAADGGTAHLAGVTAAKTER